MLPDLSWVFLVLYCQTGTEKCFLPAPCALAEVLGRPLSHVKDFFPRHSVVSVGKLPLLFGSWPLLGFSALAGSWVSWRTLKAGQGAKAPGLQPMSSHRNQWTHLLHDSALQLHKSLYYCIWVGEDIPKTPSNCLSK